MILDEKFFKFILVGIINTLVGSAIMFLLYNAAHWSYWHSSAANYIIGSVLSFFMNKYFTFKAREWSIFIIAAFIVNIVVCYFIAYGIAKPAANYFLQDASLKIQENAALFAGMCVFMGLNYLGQRFVVFKNGKGEG